MIKGLTYVGRGNGVSVELYKSYKSVVVSWNKPYEFSAKDIRSDEAKSYYERNFHRLGIRVIEGLEQDTEPEQMPTEHLDEGKVEVVETLETPDTEVKEAVEEVVDQKEEDDAEEETDEPKGNADFMTVFKEIYAEYGEDTIRALTSSDLGELLDTKFDSDQILEIAHAVSCDLGRVKKKSKVITMLVEEHLEQLVALIVG